MEGDKEVVGKKDIEEKLKKSRKGVTGRGLGQLRGREG